MTEKGSVFVVDDDAPLRKSLDFLLRMAGFQVATFPSAGAFLDKPEHEGPACLITDVRMPEMSGIELMQVLRTQKQPLPVIVMTGHADVPLAVEAMKAGALDFLEKPFDDERLIGAIRTALQQGNERSRRNQQREEVLARRAMLSERERQVLEELVKGNPNKVIAYELGISARTVEIHRAHVMSKMQARSLSDLVRMALTIGITEE